MLAFLYALYEAVRGAGDASLSVARDHTADIVALERVFNVFNERAVQEWSRGVPYLPALLGLAYMSLHFGATAFAVRWVYRERRQAFPLVRTTLIVSTAIALAGYVLYPAAPPRLAGLGFADTVTTHTGLNLSSDMLAGRAGLDIRP
jgi:cytochrome bd-type quinol oxidase subunit 2